MVFYEDECVGCPTEMGCLGNSCPNKNVRRCVCDKCGDEAETLYYWNGEELCLDCILDELEEVTD